MNYVYYVNSCILLYPVSFLFNSMSFTTQQLSPALLHQASAVTSSTPQALSSTILPAVICTLVAVSSSTSSCILHPNTCCGPLILGAISLPVSTVVVHAGTPEQQQRLQQLERLLSSAANMLPAPQLGLAMAPPHAHGPALSLDKASALGQVAMPPAILHHFLKR